MDLQVKIATAGQSERNRSGGVSGPIIASSLREKGQKKKAIDSRRVVTQLRRHQIHTHHLCVRVALRHRDSPCRRQATPCRAQSKRSARGRICIRLGTEEDRGRTQVQDPPPRTLSRMSSEDRINRSRLGLEKDAVGPHLAVAFLAEEFGLYA